MSVVLDASAFLALMLQEQGAETVFAIARGASMSAVNVSECMTRAIDRGHRSDDVVTLIDRLEIDVVPFDFDLAERAAALRNVTRPFGISLGDRACLALAQVKACPVHTADQRWANLDIGVDIRMIRQHRN